MVHASVLACVCVVLMASVASGQFYAQKPWYDRYNNNDQASSSAGTAAAPTTRRPTSSGGLADRLLTNSDGGLSFKFYNNVPIQGPDAPCVGCTYMLTQNGFVRQNRN